MKIKTLTICVISIVVILSFLPCSESAKTGKIIRAQIPAPSLASSKFGESTNEPAVIYLPHSYDNAKRFPVVYFYQALPLRLLHIHQGISRDSCREHQLTYSLNKKK